MKNPSEIATPDLSFVIPVVERHGDLVRLYEEYSSEARKLGKHAEFIFVVDYRQRDVVPTLIDLQERESEEIMLILLRGNFGESSALTLGTERARADVIVTLASYFQVDPAGLGPALESLDEGVDLVVGRRYPRRDSLFNRLQTIAFHLLVRFMTGSPFRDISCGFRVMRADLLDDLTIYGGLHRFIPILAQRRGYSVHELKLKQRQEDAPTRYYGLAVYLKRLLDVLTVFFLIKFTYRPIRFFGIAGMALGTAGLSITVYLGVYRLLGFGGIANRPLLLLGVLLAVLGIQILAIGLVGEIIIFTHSKQLEPYRIARILRAGDRDSEEAHGEDPHSDRLALP